LVPEHRDRDQKQQRVGHSVHSSSPSLSGGPAGASSLFLVPPLPKRLRFPYNEPFMRPPDPLVEDLMQIQEKYGYLPADQMVALHKRTGVPLYRIHGVASRSE